MLPILAQPFTSLQMMETPTAATIYPADLTAAISTYDNGLTTSSIMSPCTTLTDLELTPTLVFPVDFTPTPTPILETVAATSTIFYLAMSTQEVPIKPTPTTYIKTYFTLPLIIETSLRSPDTYFSLAPTGVYVAEIKTDLTLPVLEQTPTPTPKTKLFSSFEMEISPSLSFQIKTTRVSGDDFTSASHPYELPVTSSSDVTLTFPKFDIMSTPITEVTVIHNGEVTAVTEKNTTLAPSADLPSNASLSSEIPTTVDFPSDVPTTHVSPSVLLTTPSPSIPLVPCGKSYCLNGGTCRTINGSSLVSKMCTYVLKYPASTLNYENSSLHKNLHVIPHFKD